MDRLLKLARRCSYFAIARSLRNRGYGLGDALTLLGLPVRSVELYDVE